MIWRTCLMVMLIAAVAGAGEVKKEHPDYVPDQKTAERIADAVLVAQYGEDRVKVRRPLHGESLGKDYWLVQGYLHGNELPQKGDAFAVWINKHSGCIANVADHMK